MGSKRHSWTDKDLDTTIRILGKHTSEQRHEAAAEVSKSLGKSMDWNAIDCALNRRLGKRGVSFFHRDAKYIRRAAKEAAPSTGAAHSDLVELAKKHTTVERVCNVLDVSPAKLQSMVQAAREAGYIVDLTSTNLVLEKLRINDEAHQLGVPRIVGGWHWAANISDLHFGSKYCLRPQLVDFVNEAYEMGVRSIGMSGDCLDGRYRHGQFEVSHSSLEDQADDMLSTLPRKKGLKYFGITGNHEQTFAAQVGIDVGRYIQDRATGHHGRDDIRFFGGRSAYFMLGPTKIHLYHPGGGSAYAKSYKLQKKIESYAPGRKPDILFTGHYHQAIYLVERGVHAFLASSFQGGGSDFAKSLPGNGDIGGWILKWRMTEHGTIRDMVPLKKTYFERETVHNLDVEDAAE